MPSFLVKLGAALLKVGTAIAKSLACCCDSHCCGFTTNPSNIHITLESTTCANLDGKIITMVSSGVVGDNIEWTGILATGIADCFSTTWTLNCNSSPTCTGWTLTVENLSGCIIVLDADQSVNPDSCTCNPFEMTFHGTVGEDSAGGLNPCLCCAVGAAVTIRVTL